MHSCTQILHQNVHFSQIYREVKTKKFHSTDKTLWWKKDIYVRYINLILVYNIHPLFNLSHSIQNFLCFLHNSPLPSRRDRSGFSLCRADCPRYSVETFAEIVHPLHFYILKSLKQVTKPCVLFFRVNLCRLTELELCYIFIKGPCTVKQN